MVYFTSDTHFGSQRALELSKRPFKTVEEMDEKIIKNWNETVKPEDVVVHLGDFGNFDVANKLNGNKILLLGNYERRFLSENNDLIDEIRKYFIHIIFEYSVSASMLSYIESAMRLHNNNNFDLNKDDTTFLDSMIYCHEPSAAYSKSNLFGGDKNLFGSMSNFILFGHIHGRQGIKKFKNEKNETDIYGMDVGVDFNHYYPVSLDTIKFYRNATYFYDKEVFIGEEKA